MPKYYVFVENKGAKKPGEQISPFFVFAELNDNTAQALLIASHRTFTYLIYEIERQVIPKLSEPLRLKAEDKVCAYNISTNNFQKLSFKAIGSESKTNLYAFFSPVTEENASAHQKDFITRMGRFLSQEFYTKTASHQWQEIYNLRFNSQFTNLLLCDWQLSGIFLKGIADKAGPEAANALTTCRLKSVLTLDNLRREIILTEQRKRMPIRLQQQIVVGILERHRRSTPAAAPLLSMPVAGMLTVQIEQDDLEGKLNIPAELICPITQAILKDPVKVGPHYFSKVALVNTARSTGCNPLTREPLKSEDVEKLPIDEAKQREIDQFKQNYKKTYHEVLADISHTNAVVSSSASNNNNANVNSGGQGPSDQVRFDI